MRNTKNIFGLCAMGAALAFAGEAHAHGVSVLYNPYVHEGHVAVETKMGYMVDEGGSSDDAWAGEVALHYGVTSFWETEFAAEFEGADHEDTEVSALAWKNIVQLAPKDTLLVDPGVMIEYAKSVTGGPDEIIGKLLLAKDIGKFSHMANLGIAREVGDESSDENEYGFGYGLSYSVNEHLKLGGEWHSDFHDFEGSYDEQSHRVGPVAYGEIVHGVHYEAGVLLGVSDAAPDAEFKAAFEYEF